MPQCILSVFCDSIIYLGVNALLFKYTLCATPPTVLMRFETILHRIIASKCHSKHCQYFAIPLFIKELLPFVKTYTFKLLCATPPTVLMGFIGNFHRMMVTKCCSAYCQEFAIPFFLSRSYCPCFKFTLLSFYAQLLLFCVQLLIQFLCDLI